MILNWNTATEDEIIQHCSRSNPGRNVISEFEGGLSVIRISENAVVKCGMGVTKFEANNQRRAHAILDPEIIRIPQVYRFFANGLDGYLIMEYVNGQPISSIKDPDIYLEPMAKVLKHFEQVRGSKPGPFHGGIAFGQLWLDYDLVSFGTVSDIEEYYNKRQLKQRGHLEISCYPLVFCHLDIAPRNILVLEDKSLSLVDWNSAGFYPRLFERVALKINIRGEGDWNSKLLCLLDELDNGEKYQAELLEQAYYLGQKYIYRDKESKPQPPPELVPPEKSKIAAIRKRRKSKKHRRSKDVDGKEQADDA